MAGITADSWSKALNANEFSDFVIVCQGKEFHVHRVVICADSHFFHSLCTDGFQEEISGRVTLKEQNADIVKRFLQFLYTGDFNDTLSADETARKSSGQSQSSLTKSAIFNVGDNLENYAPRSDMEVDTLVYLLAERFSIKALKTLAMRKFSSRFEELFHTPPAADALRFVYQVTNTHDNGLRLAATRVCIDTFRRGTFDRERFKGAGSWVMPQSLARILQEYEPICWQIGRQVVSDWKESVEGFFSEDDPVLADCGCGKGDSGSWELVESVKENFYHLECSCCRYTKGTLRFRAPAMLCVGE